MTDLQRFYIRIAPQEEGGKPGQALVEGYPVTINGVPCFVSEDDWGLWRVTEIKTGLRCSNEEGSSTEAIDSAVAYTTKKGDIWLKEIDDMVAKYGPISRALTFEQIEKLEMWYFEMKRRAEGEDESICEGCLDREPNGPCTEVDLHCQYIVSSAKKHGVDVPEGVAR